MANLMTGSIRRRVSKVGGAELVLTPVASIASGEMLRGDSAHYTAGSDRGARGKTTKSNHAEPIRATYPASNCRP